VIRECARRVLAGESLRSILRPDRARRTHRIRRGVGRPRHCAPSSCPAASRVRGSITESWSPRRVAGDHRPPTGPHRALLTPRRAPYQQNNRPLAATCDAPASLRLCGINARLSPQGGRHSRLRLCLWPQLHRLPARISPSSPAARGLRRRGRALPARLPSLQPRSAAVLRTKSAPTLRAD